MRQRWLMAATAIGVACGIVPLWAVRADGSSAPLAWQPAARNLRHASGWVLSGERQSATIAYRHPRVLFVGDSITQWWQRFGAAAWDSDFAPLGAADDGVVDDTTSNVLARIDDGSLTGIDPRIAVLLVGTNNIPLRQSTPDIVRGILSVVAGLHERLPSTKLILVGLLPRGEPKSADRRAVTTVNNLLSRSVPGGVVYLDLGRSLVAPDGHFLPGVMNPDLLHPAAGGYARLAAGLLPVIQQLIGPPPLDI